MIGIELILFENEESETSPGQHYKGLVSRHHLQLVIQLYGKIEELELSVSRIDHKTDDAG